MSEVEEALQTLNGHLITERECQFIYHVSSSTAKLPVTWA